MNDDESRNVQSRELASDETCTRKIVMIEIKCHLARPRIFLFQTANAIGLNVSSR